VPGEVFGLDPSKSYWVDPGDADRNAPHVSLLDGEVLIDGAMLTEHLVSFSFAVLPSPVLLDMSETAKAVAIGTIQEGMRVSLTGGACFNPGEYVVRGVRKEGIMAHPSSYSIDGRPRVGQTYGVYSVDVPPSSEGECFLEGYAGLNETAEKTDGATFMVKVSGKTVWRDGVTKLMPWRPFAVDLSGYAGKSIEIELVTDAGPAKDNSWDHAVWGEPRVVLRRNLAVCSADIALTTEPCDILCGSDLSSQATEPQIKVHLEANGAQLDAYDATLPCTLFTLYRTPSLVELTEEVPFCDLVTLPYSTTISRNHVFEPGSAWGGGSVESIAIDGIPMNSINGHPPAKGKTALTWIVRLPERKCRLKMEAGVKPNASTGGVGFAVHVNGSGLWHKSLSKPGWTPVDIDLSRYAGKVVVLQLITDSLGDEFCDWAAWVQPRIETANN
jgi:hypothetical protein